MEKFDYIENIPDSEMQDVVRATIRLPSDSSKGYDGTLRFDNFIIFYRIYISDIVETSLIASTTTNDVFNRTLNTSLYSDFSNLYSYTNKTSTSVSTSNLEIIFSNRKYFQLELENAVITSVLGSGSLGKTLTIFFPQNTGVSPTLFLDNNTQHTLLRNKDSIGNNASIAMRSQRFLNHPDLYNPANAIVDVNGDVATNPNPNIRYTYVSMYIAAKATNFDLPPKFIYSQPTFIGVFKLAESS